MNKPIAERFLLYFRGICPKSGQPYQLNDLDFRDVAKWLKEQPENKKTFSLEEVENLIMEAYLDAQYMMAMGAITTPRKNSFEYQAKEYARVKKEGLME